MLSLSKHAGRTSSVSSGTTQQVSAPRLAAAATLLLGCAASLALSWPGQLSWDSVMQLHDGRSGHYNPWHPPVMAWTLGVFDALVPGTGLFVVFDTVLFFASLASLLWIARRPSWPAVAIAAICTALPQVLVFQGIVWKDMLFADASVAGFVCLTHAAAHWREPRRWLLLVAAFACLALATLARQNGLVALIFGLIAFVLVARRNGQGWPKSLAFGVSAAICTSLVLFVANVLLEMRTEDAWSAPAQIRLLQLYDLTGEVKRDPALRLEGLAHANPKLMPLIRSDGVRLYTPARNDTLIADPRLLSAFGATAPVAVSSQWLNVIIHHPADYLGVRAQVFRWVFLTPDIGQCMPYITGVTGPPRYLKELGVARPFRAQDRALGSYAALFLATPLYSHATYALLALALLIFLIRRRRSADIAMAGMLAGALVFTACFFVISIACDYRYLLFLDLSALTALFYCTCENRRHGRPC
jgi:4-amino-4-deoxy-L-arabinose transferase-like glycosyltransferase